MILNQKNFIIFCIILSSFSVCGCNSQKNSFSNTKDVTKITISQEYPYEAVEVESIQDFIGNLQFEKWKKLDNFTLKSCPKYYIHFEPNDILIGIINSNEDETICCAKIDNNYYKYPKEVYNFICQNLTK